ncbi:MAG: radical SAM protein [Myxococcales bacterium]|nr:radical SAM protein [Myxococcales bacterium]
MRRASDPLVRLAGRVDWLELVVGFACNCRCRVCSSGFLDPRTRLSNDDLAAWLGRGRKLGATGVWFGGGEPTLHEGLPRAVERALNLGYRRIRLQTNGLRLAYPEYLAALRQAGLTEVALSVKGWDARSHDDMLRRAGAWELLGRAAAHVREAGLQLEADVLLTNPLLSRLPRLVEDLARRGVERLTFWLVSLHGAPDDDDVPALVPPLGRLRRPLREAFARAARCGVAATSLHTPPCSLAPEDRDRYLHAGRYRLLVVVPGNDPFLAEESPMERGEHPAEPCGACAIREGCLGLRAEQLRLFGTAGLAPVAAPPRRRAAAGASPPRPSGPGDGTSGRTPERNRRPRRRA